MHERDTVPAPGTGATTRPELRAAMSDLVCISSVDGATSISLIGEIDLGAFDELSTLLVTECSRPGVRVVIDLGSVEFLDSTGIRLLLDLQRAATDADGSLRVVNIPEPVRRTMEMGGVADLLDGSA